MVACINASPNLVCGHGISHRWLSGSCTNGTAGLDSPTSWSNLFDILQSGWGGILAIAIIGPVLEEILFRGAITRALLQQYNPTKSHSDFRASVRRLSYKSSPDPSRISLDRYPARMDLLQNRQSDTLYTDACAKQFIVSLYLSIKYPEAENMDDLINGSPYLVVSGRFNPATYLAPY